MTDTPRPWDRLTAESDPAFEAFAAYLETGSLRDAYRQRSGKAQATAAPGAWTGWSTKYNWVSRRAAFVEFTVRECQDAIQIGLVQIRKRLIDAANELLDDDGVPAVRAASRVIVENFPPLARVADVSDGEQIEDISDIPFEDLEKMREIRDAARAKAKGEVPTYPALWAHTTKEQRSISFDGDSQGVQRKGKTKNEQEIIDTKVARVWASASHLHFNRDFRFNSQSSGMQFTSRKTMGGAAWISVSLASGEQEKALALWVNTSIGFLLHWLHANRQQSGRGRIGVLPLRTLPVLDVTELSKKTVEGSREAVRRDRCPGSVALASAPQG